VAPRPPSGRRSLPMRALSSMSLMSCHARRRWVPNLPETELWNYPFCFFPCCLIYVLCCWNQNDRHYRFLSSQNVPRIHQYNSLLPSPSSSYKRAFCNRFFNQNSLCIPYHCHSGYMSTPSLPSWFSYRNKSAHRVTCIYRKH
jgi:hypothetical protein